VNDREIDKLLTKAARVPDETNAMPLDRIIASIKPSFRPVRPLPSTRKLVIALFMVCITVSVAGAARAGFYGFAKMSLPTRVITFLTLSLLILMADIEFVHDMIPGSLRRWSPAALLGICTAVLLSVFALLFRDPGMDHFISAGIKCLLAGLLHAVPAGLLSWLVLRRGFAVRSISAGFAAGTLGGLAGVGLLEMHCPNFQSAHVLLWHIVVVPLSAAVGALTAYLVPKLEMLKKKGLRG
jgi:hypothetical protein